MAKCDICGKGVTFGIKGYTWHAMSLQFFVRLGRLVGDGVVGLAIETWGDAYVFLEKAGKV